MHAMTFPDNAYSHLVAGLKVVLPLAALGILSTLFLLSGPREGQGVNGYSDAEIDRIVSDGRIGRPTYAGVDGRGAEIVLTADSATPEAGGSDRMVTQSLEGYIATPDGARLELAAPVGTVDSGAGTALLSGGVTLHSSAGYRIDAPALTTSLDSVAVTATGPLAAVGPPGRLTAKKMTLRRDEMHYTMRFDGVTLIYDPSTGAAE